MKCTGGHGLMGIYDSRSDRFNSGATNGRHYLQAYDKHVRVFVNSLDFQEHNQRMREFYLAHTKNLRQWGRMVSGVKEDPRTFPLLALIQKAVPLRYSPN